MFQAFVLYWENLWESRHQLQRPVLDIKKTLLVKAFPNQLHFLQITSVTRDLGKNLIFQHQTKDVAILSSSFLQRLPISSQSIPSSGRPIVDTIL